jgi:hypothetical protein
VGFTLSNAESGRKRPSPAHRGQAAKSWLVAAYSRGAGEQTAVPAQSSTRPWGA